MAKAVTPALVLRTLCIVWIVALGVAELWPGFGLWLPGENSVGQRVGESVLMTGRIKTVEAGGQSQQLTLDQLTVDSQVATDRLLVFAPRYPELAYGQVISARCQLKAPEPFNGFRYDRYLAAKDIYATCFVYDAPLVIGKSSHFIIEQLLKFRRATLRQIDQTFTEPGASLLSGLLLGADELSDAWKENFRRTGTAHVVVASGYNVTIVLTWLLAGLTLIGLNRRQSFVWLLLGLFGYIVLAGAGAPIIRAAILGGATLFAKQLGRRTDGIYLLLLVASAMLIVNPLLLLGDIGFQLSMLATAGLMIIDPWLLPKLKWVTVEEIRTSLSSTLSATIATLPLTVFTFGSISLVAPIANLLILPLVPLAMISGTIVLVISYFWSTLGLLVGIIPSAILELILWIVKLLARLPFAYVAQQ